MAVEIKVAPDEKLELVRAQILDTALNSNYFNVTELSDTLSGGKNAFLIAGSELLEPNSEIKVQIRDSAGEVIYYEFSDGYPAEYYEGISKVVAIYVYPTVTAFGPATITLVGQVKNTKDLVKWERKVNIDPSLPNTTRVRFYKRPKVTISEILEPIYTITTTGVQTYSGSAILIPVVPASGSNYAAWLGQGNTDANLEYRLQPTPQIEDFTIISASAVGAIVTTDIPGYSPTIIGATDDYFARISPPLLDINGNIQGRSFMNSISYSYSDTSIAVTTKTASNVTQSFANIKVSQLDTFAGDVKRVKVYRTSEGDISDYDLIQDILIESKEILTTTALSGSVVGEAGLFTTETLKKVWNTGSLNAALTSSRIDNGVSLKGSGYLRYTSSLNLNTGNTYELGIDAFYSASKNSDLGIYISGSQNGETLIGTLNGIAPTKNLKDTILQFSLDKAEPTASLYLSQSQSEWHVGNISLKLSEDSAFSPSEISFVTSMPTVLGNEIYNFKFEFYDVNNNYVPVAVTQSALFTGGNNNIGGTLVLISGSISASEAGLLALSQSVSGTIGNVTSSVSQSFVTSSFYSASLMTTALAFSSSASSSISSSKAAAISSSFGNIQTLANGGFSGSFISDTTIYAPVIGGTTGYISQLFKVGTTPSIYLDARQSPRKIFIGGAIPSGQTEYSGSHNNSNTSVYMDSDGKFSLGNKLSWNGTDTLTVTGNINITGGTASDQINGAASSGSNALAYAIANNATASVATVDAKVFTDSTGKLSKTPTTNSSGLFLGQTYMGYYDGSNWKTYMANNGNFYLSGTGTNYLSWASNTLTINGSINTTDANIGGWVVNSTSIYKGAISLNSNTPEIAMNGSITKVKLGTRNLVELSGTADQRTVYLGEGGIKITGDWNGSTSEYPSYITLAADSSYAKAIFFNKNVGYSSELVYMYACPQTNNTTLKVENGGAWFRNYNDGSGYTGTGNQGYALRLTGGLYVGGAGEFTGDVTANTSDRRLKTNIKNIDSPLEKLSKINGVYFNWNDTAKKLADKDTEKREVGFIAQEVQSVLPEIIKPAPFDVENSNGGSKSGENYLTIQYEKIVPLLVECIKELKSEIEELKKNK